jgi:IS4 transposase
LALPRAAEPLVASFSVAFSRPSFQRFVVLFVGAILAGGRHTVTACLRAALTLAHGHASSYHRLFSRARWSLWPLAHVLAAAVLELVPPNQSVRVVVDDTTAMHKGKNVYGKAKHHDACRSTHSHMVWVWGHKWVVLAVLVKFPFASRAWALPVLMALYRPRELNEKEGRRHKTPLDLGRQLAAALIHWFPQRRFILLGDGGFASHDLARFCFGHRRRLSLVSRLHPRANLYDPPPARKPGQGGRPRVKGRKRSAPADVVDRTPQRQRVHATVNWYGGARRKVQLVSGTAHWYRGGGGLVPIRWVFVHDLDGTHRDQYFYSTEVDLKPQEIVSLYTGRWSIEVTFQEAKFHLGLETTRQRVEKSVQRAFPCLLGLFSVVSLIYARHVGRRKPAVDPAPWYHKAEPTFSNAMSRVRRLLWTETVLEYLDSGHDFSKLPPKIRNTILEHLTRIFHPIL